MNTLVSITSVIKDKILDKIENLYYNNYDTVDRLYKENDLYHHVSETCNNYLSEPTHIIDNIYLGNAINACNIETLDKFKIKSIINVTEEIPNYFKDNENLNYLKIPIRDNQNASLSEYHDQLINFFEDNSNNNILVHCYMGISRSTCVVLLYLIKKFNYNLDDAIDYVKTKRNIINPNILLYNELKNL